MTHYMISYDLDKNLPSQDYTKMHQIILEISKGMWIKPLKTCYVIASDHTPTELAERLKKVMTSKDYVFIAEINIKNLASVGLSQEIAEAFDRI